MTPFKIDVFTNDFVFQDFSIISEPTIEFDYLTLESFQLQVPKKLLVERGDYIIISQGTNVLYNGIVSVTSYKKGITELTITPILSILNVDCYFNRNNLKINSLENFIKNIIEELYINNDIEQNIKGLQVEILSETLNAKLNLKDNIHNLWEICIASFKKYNIIIKTELNAQSETIKIIIDTISQEIETIELKLPNIIDYEINLRDDYGKVNKVTIVNKKNEQEQHTFYSDDFKRPVFFTYEFIEFEETEESETTFFDEAQLRADELFTPQQFQNLIEITTTTDNNLINCKIGTNVSVKENGNSYNSVITGINIKGKVCKLILGAVRLELSKILILEKRGD